MPRLLAGPTWVLRDNSDPAAAAGFFGHVDLGGDALLHGGDVGDNADGFAAGLKVLQRRHRDFQGVRIQRAEAFVISTKGRMSFTVCQSASWIAWSRASENSAR